ncbi:MAG: response regulator transcription factor [Phototrophicaceae bacterium]
MSKILLVDDDENIVELAKMYLLQEQHQVLVSQDGLSALNLIFQEKPDLVVLDLMLPAMDGREVCKQVRMKSDVPIIMLTALSDDIDKIVGLELGADDYLTKPFNPRELTARVRAILRRVDKSMTVSKQRSSEIVIGNLKIDAERRTVQVNQQMIDLRMKEFDLLLMLVQNPRIVFSREKLLQLVWGYDFAGETRTVDMHVAHLRNKLERMTPSIETVWGVGYKLEY